MKDETTPSFMDRPYESGRAAFINNFHIEADPFRNRKNMGEKQVLWHQGYEDAKAET